MPLEEAEGGPTFLPSMFECFYVPPVTLVDETGTGLFVALVRAPAFLVYWATAAKRLVVFLKRSAGASIAPFSYLCKFNSRSALIWLIVLYEVSGILEQLFNSIKSRIAAQRACPTSNSISAVNGGG